MLVHVLLLSSDENQLVRVQASSRSLSRVVRHDCGSGRVGADKCGCETGLELLERSSLSVTGWYDVRWYAKPTEQVEIPQVWLIASDDKRKERKWMM